ncbi:unnamed protein product [Prorocentrum cordatum]|uniref:Uncharacterized protein n=1 Tax=Prorocentrum cordatum TaxID=2364126 RepID=A0ABN9QWA4_9DINO|nr:unnamed protein product [Polarella glacialis]
MHWGAMPGNAMQSDAKRGTAMQSSALATACGMRHAAAGFSAVRLRTENPARATQLGFDATREGCSGAAATDPNGAPGPADGPLIQNTVREGLERLRPVF